MSIREKLTKVVGSQNYSDKPEVLKSYSKDFSLEPSGLPNYVVKPKDAQQVQKIIELANEHKIPVVPVSSKVHFNGAAIPNQGGIVMDLTGMKKILEIDELNRRARIEAGVTWEQMHKELDKKGLRIMMPLLPHPQRSVVTDTLEREIITNTVYDYGEPMQSIEVVWPSGEIFRMGSASVNGYPDSPSKGANPSGPGLDFYRFVQGAQGTMGVVTWINTKIENKTKMDKVLMAPIYEFDRVIEFLYRILRIRIGQECLLLNNVDLAAILAAENCDDLEKLKATLPPWTLILVLSGHLVRPEEKIKYEEDTLKSILRSEFSEIALTDSLPGVPGLDKKLLPLLREPWPGNLTYWKHRYTGACQNLSFITKPNMAPMFIELVNHIATDFGYPIEDIGGYIQPIEHNRACYQEFDFFYDPDDEAEAENISSLYLSAAKILLDEGALFTRPYGRLSDMVYERADGYATTLRRVKKIFDPNNIMNPGKLCF